MRFPGKGKDPLPIDVRKVALTALAAALEDGRQVAKDEKKKGMTGVRAVAAGAVLVTAGRAVYKGGRFVRERFGSDEEEPEAVEDDDFEEQDYEEPEAEAEEDFEDEEVEDEAEEDEEPEDEADDDFDDEDFDEAEED